MDLYKLEIAQPPELCRTCNSATKEKRTVEPPPVLELVAVDGVLLPPKDLTYLVVHTTLWNEDLSADMTISDASRQSLSKNAQEYLSSAQTRLLSPEPVLSGSLVENGQWLYNEHGRKGFFFIFKDLRIRLEGRYRLRFALFDLGMTIDTLVNQNRILSMETSSSPSSSLDGLDDGDDFMELADGPVPHQAHSSEGEGESDGGDAGSSSSRTPSTESGSASASANEANACSIVFTDVFVAYSSKKYPGMRESTELSRAFARQGVKLTIRDDRRRSRLQDVAAAAAAAAAGGGGGGAGAAAASSSSTGGPSRPPAPGQSASRK
ncbi:hypothetical protein RI367_003015 [Sorochytrium milnesiophthora]